jgi:AAA domain
LRIDQAADRERLERTIAELKPRLLVLDPFVRLHRIDENASGEVAPLLAYLRTLQRQYQLAVLVVHHARKSAGRMRAGQALRGSSEFHAWGDSNLYLRRSGGELNLTVEHRAAPSPPAIGLELAQRGDALALEIVQSIAPPSPPPISIDERITAAIAEANRPLPIAELRSLCRVRNGTLYERLTALTDAGQIVRAPEGYQLATRP